MNDPLVAGAFSTWLGQAIVVSAGWYVVHRLSAKRDLDKSRRELVAKSADALVDSLSEVLQLARKYHLETRDVGAEINLKMTIQDLSQRVNAMADICEGAEHVAACRSALIALRRAITGLHFEDEHQTPLAVGDRQLESIAEAVMTAKLQTIRLKHSQFPVMQ